MYLREMGGVELLSREGEIAIAKRIEAGKDVMLNALSQSPITAQQFYDWNDKLSSFLDTACVISQLDLVVSVDTAVAHVAGALDKPVWVLLQHNADFRWMRGRTDSPWYSSMSLFRQKSLGDWSSALESLQERLIHLLGP